MKAVHTEYLEDFEITVHVEADPEDEEPYKLSFDSDTFEKWMSEKDLNVVIRLLNRMKRIRKTKQLE